MAELCPHGMAGYCPDCPSTRGFNVGEDMAAPTATVKDGRDGMWVVVQRTKADGSFDWFTWHATRRGARRAAALYLRTGRVVGVRP